MKQDRGLKTCSFKIMKMSDIPVESTWLLSINAFESTFMGADPTPTEIK